MTRLEKIVVSTDPETAALIEEIQNAVYDRLVEAIEETLPKTKISASAVDITPILENQKKILENQKLILEALSNNAEREQYDGNYPLKLQLWTKDGKLIQSLDLEGDGIYRGTVVKPWNQLFYVADSNGKPYGIRGKKIVPGRFDCPFNIPKGRFDVIFSLKNLTFEYIAQ